MREDLGKTGMDKEEEYFYRKNKELIEQRRAELEAKKQAQEASALRDQHWMRCPKCGHQMEEIEMAGIKVDKCTECNGVYFDEGELDILLEAQSPEGFLGGLKKIFRG